jgi:hypothetical protein
MHGDQPDFIDINLAGRVGSESSSETVTSEPRRGGIQELRIAFDATPGVPGPGAVVIESQAIGAECARGTEEAYAAHPISMKAEVKCNELVLFLDPPLENGRTYRITLGGEVTAMAGQSFEVRCLMGDMDSSGRVNLVDRSFLTAAWTGTGYSAETDLSGDGHTNGTDRSLWMSSYTSAVNCAP